MAKKTAMVSIRIVSDANTRGFKKAAAASNDLVKHFTKFTAISTSVASAAALAGGAIGQIAGGAAALTAAAGPALATVALGFEGIKEAATAAQEPFEQLKADLSASFANEMTGSFERLGGLLTDLNRPLADLGATTGAVFAGMLDTVSANGDQLAALTAGATDFISSLGPGLDTLIDGFLQIGTVIQDTGGILGESFGNVLATIGDKFAEFSNNGLLEEMVNGFAQALDGLSNLIGPLLELLARLGAAMGPVLGDVFSALGVAVEGLIDPLTRVLEAVGPALVDALNVLAPAFGPVAAAIASLVEALAPLLEPLATVVATLGEALAAAVEAVAPLIADIAGLLGDLLVGALDALAPLLPALVDAIGILADSFRPLIPVVKDVAADLFPVLADVIREISPLLPEMAGLVGELISSLAPMIPPLGEIAKALFPALGDILQAVFPIIGTVVGVVAELLEALTPLLDPLADLADVLFPAVADIVEALSPIIQFLAKVVGELTKFGLEGLVGILSTVVDWFGALIDKISVAIDWLRDFSDWVDSIPVPDFGDAFGANPWPEDVSVSGEFHGAGAGGMMGRAATIAGARAPAAAPTVINVNVTDSVVGNERHLADVVTRAIRKTETNLARREVYTR